MFPFFDAGSLVKLDVYMCIHSKLVNAARQIEVQFKEKPTDFIRSTAKILDLAFSSIASGPSPQFNESIRDVANTLKGQRRRVPTRWNVQYEAFVSDLERTAECVDFPAQYGIDSVNRWGAFGRYVAEQFYRGHQDVDPDLIKSIYRVDHTWEEERVHPCLSTVQTGWKRGGKIDHCFSTDQRFIDFSFYPLGFLHEYLSHIYSLESRTRSWSKNPGSNNRFYEGWMMYAAVVYLIYGDWSPPPGFDRPCESILAGLAQQCRERFLNYKESNLHVTRNSELEATNHDDLQSYLDAEAFYEFLQNRDYFRTIAVELAWFGCRSGDSLLIKDSEEVFQCRFIRRLGAIRAWGSASHRERLKGLIAQTREVRVLLPQIERLYQEILGPDPIRNYNVLD